jgi:hypothetical protein
MSIAEAEIVVDKSPDEVWERLRDLSLAPNYVAGLTGSKFLTDRTEGVGTSRHVFQGGQPPLTETVVQWIEGRGFVLALTTGEGADAKPLAPFAEAFFHYRIEPTGDGRTRFKPGFEYRMKPGLLGVLLDRLMLNRVMRGRMQALARDFKGYYETGRPTNPAYKAA